MALLSDKNKERWSGESEAWLEFLFKFYVNLQFGSYCLFPLENDAFSVICDDWRKSVKPVF